MLGDPFITTMGLLDYLRVSGSVDQTWADLVVSAASQKVRDFCGRDFNKTTVATPRRYQARGPLVVKVDDFHTLDDLVVEVDTGDNGAYETLWDGSDFEVAPFGGIVDGITGFPYSELWAVGSLRFPCGGKRRARVQVTAQWGWAQIPDPVVTATYLIAAQLFGLRNSPLGVSTGDFGVVRVRDVPHAADMLIRYRHPVHTAQVA